MSERTPHFLVFADKAGEYRWRFVAANNRTIADSGEGYASRFGVKRAITTFLDLVAGLATCEGRKPYFHDYQDKAGEYRWRFAAANNRTIADSGEGYASSFSVKRAIATLVETVAGLSIRDVRIVEVAAA